jgi:hypothetical protein
MERRESRRGKLTVAVTHRFRNTSEDADYAGDHARLEFVEGYWRRRVQRVVSRLPFRALVRLARGKPAQCLVAVHSTPVTVPQPGKS